MKYDNTVKYQVETELNRRLELGGEQELYQLEKVSRYNIDTFVSDFRANKTHLIDRPFKNSTVNRYVEKWLKKQFNKFNK
jgi:hypothetical protein